MKEKLRTVYIVVEETGADNGKGFNVYLAGDIQRMESIKPNQFSPAEFWGAKFFEMCGDMLANSGSIKNKRRAGLGQ